MVDHLTRVEGIPDSKEVTNIHFANLSLDTLLQLPHITIAYTICQNWNRLGRKTVAEETQHSSIGSLMMLHRFVLLELIETILYAP